jgi:hypothetical protein
MKMPVLTPYMRKSLQRVVAVFIAVPMVLVVAGAALVPSVSAIGGQVLSRKITLSDNQVSGGATGGTGVSYDVYANSASAYTLKGIVVDFCSGATSPIIGTTCTAPTGMSLGTPTFTPDTTTTNAINTTGWTAATIQSGRAFALTNATGITTTTASTNSILHFTITGVTNPSTLGTFYARIMTFTSTATALAYTATTPGSYQDYGGFALSTANPVSITARVQETLTYCVSGLDMSGASTGIQFASGTSCAAETTPTFVLGHGGTTQSTFTIDNSQTDTDVAYTQISTNASQGAVVRMKNFNTCSNAGLSSNGGTTCNISGVAGTSIPSPSLGSVPAAITAGTTGFGLYVSTGAATTGVSTSSGTYTPDANYHDASHTTEPTVSTVNSLPYYSANPNLWYGDDQDATSGVGTTYGDVVATTGGAPCSQMNNHLVFGVTAGLTIPAGIYTATIGFIATGTF